MKTISNFFAEWKDELYVLFPLAGIYAAFFSGPALELDSDTRSTLILWAVLWVTIAMLIHSLLEEIAKAAKKRIDKKHQTDNPDG